LDVTIAKATRPGCEPCQRISPQAFAIVSAGAKILIIPVENSPRP
jgi:hypothetical protein